MKLEGVKGEAVLENVHALAFENVTINGKRQPDRLVDIGSDGQVR